jgi:hypothetical protein
MEKVRRLHNGRADPQTPLLTTQTDRGNGYYTFRETPSTNTARRQEDRMARPHRFVFASLVMIAITLGLVLFPMAGSSVARRVARLAPLWTQKPANRPSLSLDEHRHQAWPDYATLNDPDSSIKLLAHGSANAAPHWSKFKYIFAFGDSYTTTAFDPFGQPAPSQSNPLVSAFRTSSCNSHGVGTYHA